MDARIVALVESAEDQKAPVQQLADRVAAWLIPAVFLFLIGVFLLKRDVRLVITLLVFTSPAELGLATPLVIIAAVARAARSGILVKGSLVLEQLAEEDSLNLNPQGVFMAEREARAVLVEEALALEPTDHRVAEQLLGGGGADVRHGDPLARGGPAAPGSSGERSAPGCARSPAAR